MQPVSSWNKSWQCMMTFPAHALNHRTVTSCDPLHPSGRVCQASSIVERFAQSVFSVRFTSTCHSPLTIMEGVGGWMRPRCEARRAARTGVVGGLKTHNGGDLKHIVPLANFEVRVGPKVGPPICVTIRVCDARATRSVWNARLRHATCLPRCVHERVALRKCVSPAARKYCSETSTPSEVAGTTSIVGARRLVGGAHHGSLQFGLF